MSRIYKGPLCKHCSDLIVDEGRIKSFQVLQEHQECTDCYLELKMGKITNQNIHFYSPHSHLCSIDDDPDMFGRKDPD